MLTGLQQELTPSCSPNELSKIAKETLYIGLSRAQSFLYIIDQPRMCGALGGVARGRFVCHINIDCSCPYFPSTAVVDSFSKSSQTPITLQRAINVAKYKI
jgi:hypothetical protein